MPVTMSFGEKLQLYRRRAGLTQTQLGEKLGVSMMSVWFWENDKKSPTWHHVIALAETLQIRTDDLRPGAT